MQTITTTAAITHHCSECGEQVTGNDVCAQHPNAMIDSVVFRRAAAVRYVVRFSASADAFDADAYAHRNDVRASLRSSVHAGDALVACYDVRAEDVEAFEAELEADDAVTEYRAE